MIVYLDTSTVLRILLRQRGALRAWSTWEAAYSSEIFSVEARRIIDRLRLEAALDDEGVAQAHEDLARMEQSIGRIAVTQSILRRAIMAMPTVVGTLDAIHLASALLFQEETGAQLVFATHDTRQTTAARALGFHCVG